jgi:hypothetical protein
VNLRYRQDGRPARHKTESIRSRSLSCAG